MIFHARLMTDDNNVQTLQYKIALHKLLAWKDPQKMETRVIKVRTLFMHEYNREGGLSEMRLIREWGIREEVYWTVGY